MLRNVVSVITFAIAACTVLCASDGCLDRPVVAGNPVTNTNFITSISQGSINKVDLLFDIDNSASMGDKQEYLAEAVPDLIGRLVAPKCLLADGTDTGQTADVNGVCANTQANAEFPPVHNLHIGVISSSLGPRGGDACPVADPSNLATCTSPNQTGCSPVDSTLTLAGGKIIDRHNDDQAHLLNRSSANTMPPTYTDMPLGDATDAAGDNFLDWFPMATSNTGITPTGPTPVTDAKILNSDFTQMVVGVHQFGCGIESQLESWYRFLIQPDPYASIGTKSVTLSGQKQPQTIAVWNGVDTTILAQRADFLRPDSLVAILVLTDENDSEVDVRSIGGTGFNFMSQNSFNPPRGTSTCQSGVAANVAGSGCTSCAFGGSAGDSSCQTNNGVYTSAFDWGWDLNLRHVHEKQKYGVDVQFPIQRYVMGLTSAAVPDRDDEYPLDTNGDGGYANSSYSGLTNHSCVNPLFAASLPTAPGGNVSTWKPTPAELCKLAPGTRTPSLVFYAHIGGVPHQLLQVNPHATDPTGQSQKATLTAADWQLILGANPLAYDYTGIDPHMVESYQPRTGVTGVGLPVPLPSSGTGWAVSDPSAVEGTDPISGREWITNSSPTGTGGSTTFPQGAQHNGLSIDREYACIFKLPTGTRDCSDSAVAKDPTLADSCDCQTPVTGTGTTFSHVDLPAVCNDTIQTNQDSAKAYPTIRELLLAKLLGDVPGANVGIISSLCPIDINDNATMDDPLYGYRPAMSAIIAKLGAALSSQCLPQRLVVSANPAVIAPNSSTAPMGVDCLVLGTFPSNGPDGGQSISSCSAANPAGTPAGQGWVDPNATVIAEFKADQHATWAATPNNGTIIDPSTELTCELAQFQAEQPCDTNNDVGWCYVDDGTVKGCPQAILFNKQALTQGVVTSLQCLEESPSILNDAGTFVTAPAATSEAGASDADTSGD